MVTMNELKVGRYYVLSEKGKDKCNCDSHEKIFQFSTSACGLKLSKIGSLSRLSKNRVELYFQSGNDPEMICASLFYDLDELNDYNFQRNMEQW